MPKLSGLMNDGERALCARVKQFRDWGGWSQEFFASKLGLTRAQLTGIEGGWTPLRYNLAWRIATRFGLNMRWLATGQVPHKPAVSIPSELASKIQENGLFSQVYATSLADHFEGAAQFIDTVNKLRQQLDDVCAGRVVSLRPGEPISFFIARPEWLPAMRHKLNLLKQFRRMLAREVRELEEAIRQSDHHHRTHPGETPQTVELRIVEPEVAHGNEYLTISEGASTSSPMPSLADLRKRLGAATAQRGAQTALAREFGVTRQAVSQWISGANAPEAATTLKLLQWIEEKEKALKLAAASSLKPSPKVAPAKAAKRKAKG